MSSYIHFTEEEKEQARNTDLAALLKRRGETLKRAGSEYEWQSDSEKVTIRGSLWYHQYEREGGDAIGFVQRYGNLTFAEAVASLLSEQGIVITGQHGRETQREKKLSRRIQRGRKGKPQSGIRRKAGDYGRHHPEIPSRLDVLRGYPAKCPACWRAEPDSGRQGREAPSVRKIKGRHAADCTEEWF